MSYNNLNPIDKSTLLLDAIAQKQQIIGANLANVNTPGYVRKDVSFSQLLSSDTPLETQLSAKLGPSPMMMQYSKEGTKVRPAQELAILQKNMLQYTIATRRVSSVIQQMRTVTQVGK